MKLFSILEVGFMSSLVRVGIRYEVACPHRARVR